MYVNLPVPMDDSCLIPSNQKDSLFNVQPLQAFVLPDTKRPASRRCQQNVRSTLLLALGKNVQESWFETASIRRAVAHGESTWLWFKKFDHPKVLVRGTSDFG